MTQVSILGRREQGQDVRTENSKCFKLHKVLGVVSLANIVKSSLGPQGLDKMLVDEIGDVTITNDGKINMADSLRCYHPKKPRG